jgi:phosphoglycolate phosphatase
LRPSPFRLFVFDLDGTLVDSRRDIADAANALLESCGATPLAEDRIGRMVGDGAAVLVARAFAAGGVEAPPDALDRFLLLYQERLLVHTRPYPGIPDALEALGRQATLAVLTNKPLRATREVLAGLDLARFFADDAIVGGDGPFPRKPHPDGLQHIQTVAAADPSSTLLVGDSIIDFRTARAARTPICLARYGFGFEGFPVDLLRSADRTIDTPIGLLRL